MGGLVIIVVGSVVYLFTNIRPISITMVEEDDQPITASTDRRLTVQTPVSVY